MELSGWTIYWITRLEACKVFCGVTAGISVLFLLIIVCILSTEELEWKQAKKWVQKLIILLVLGIIGAIFIPTNKEAAAILIIPAIMNNKDMKEIPGEISELAREWIEELNPKKEGKE